VTNRNYSTVSAVVFTLVALLHLWRFALGLPLEIGAWSVPPVLSLIAGLVTGSLAIWGFRSGRPVTGPKVVYT
jgi:hypothetical protein